MRSKIKQSLLAGLGSIAVIFPSCKEATSALPPEENAEGEKRQCVAEEQETNGDVMAKGEADLLKKLPAQQAREAKERAAMNAKAPEGMVYIPSGEYLRGNTGKDPQMRVSFPEEFPAHVVEVSGFYMDATEVTNAEFADFVESTGYKTQAEEGLKQADFPHANPLDLQGGANVFKKLDHKINPWKESPLRWWSFTPGATWRTPEGPGSSIEDRMSYPVVCVSYDDAQAYAKWAGKRLPTEAEWERAARAGKHKKMYAWGDEIKVGDKWVANVFQGDFPSTEEKEDGYSLSAPVKSYPANAWGLYDMGGNVWEICSDYYHPGYYHQFIKAPAKDPKGPEDGISDMERVQYNSLTGACPEPKRGMAEMMKLRVLKGGSFLCSTKYCHRFRPAARHQHEIFTPAHHIGFRCVKDANLLIE